MKKHWWWWGAIAIGVMLLLTLLAAPSSSKLNSGSTYSRSPDGYGAWYAFMEKQGTKVKRWQKPLQNLPTAKRPITLLRVNSQLSLPQLEPSVQEWVEKGNTFVMLGVRTPVTKANFSTLQESALGRVKIETQRRLVSTDEGSKRWLGDRFGAVVWENKIGKGRVIFAATPHLAANAYQNEPGNYKFLAELVTQANNSIWVDEYSHGYKEKEVIVAENGSNWITYLAKTPLFPSVLQAGIILIVLILAKNRRFGMPVTLTAPAIDNSEAYIQALAGVLQKAESREFVLEVVGKEEQLQLQKSLGLDCCPLDPQSVVDVWVRQTGRPAAELKQLLQMPSRKQRLSDRNLVSWLKKWQKIRARE